MSVAYEANRGEDYDPAAERERNDKNNAKTVSTAADVAIASKEPHAVAVGAAIKGVDAVTGGKGSEIIGKGLTNYNNSALNPLGNTFQKASNSFAESGAADKVSKAASKFTSRRVS